MDNLDNKILFDWLSFTIRYADNDYKSAFDAVLILLGFKSSDFEQKPGIKGFEWRYYYDGISIHVNNPKVNYIWVEMSGQGCRNYESHGLNQFEILLPYLANTDLFKITRIDIAYDDFTSDLSADRCFDDTLAHNYVSRMTAWSVTKSSKGTSVIIGSVDSDILIRIYDKARERGYNDGRNWTRIELQLRDNIACNFALLSLPIGQAYRGVLLNYLRFVDPSDDCNRSRWPMTDYWQKVVGSVEKISLFDKPGIEYNLAQLKKYVYKQPNMSVQTLIEILGPDEFMCELKAHMPSFVNPKYSKLLNEYKEYQRNIAFRNFKNHVEQQKIVFTGPTPWD